jgi:hypothetical protein
MNSSGKGARIERMCELELIQQGYTTHKVIRSKWIKKDIFGLFDVIGFNRLTNLFILIQCKSSSGYTSPSLRVNFENFFHFTSPYFSVEIWAYIDRKGFRKFRMQKTGEKVEWIEYDGHE